MAPKKQQKPAGPGLAGILRQAGQQARATAIESTDHATSDLLASMDTQAQQPLAGAPVLNRPRIFNILDYIESSWGLGMVLYPVQRFIVKLYYHIPLDAVNKSIHITDMFNSRVLYDFTEVEYLQYLFNEGRCNIGVQDHERRELVLAIGRRAGKSTLAGIFASYEVYRLLNLQHPQGFYGLPPGNRIQIISIGTDKDQAGILFNEVTSHLSRCEYFSPFIANNTQSYIQFRTPHDIDRYGGTVRHENGKFVSFNGKATIRVTFKSCIAKGLRGFGNIVIILDEMAHFQSEGQSSAKDIYDAITPSTAAFSPKDPTNNQQAVGPVEARIICISSPLNKAGKFYELYHQAMAGGEGAYNMLALQAPTWEVNPTVETNYYRQKYHADPTSFMTEHGAQFSDRVRGWIEREADLLACIDPLLVPKERGIPRYPHEMGLDIGLVGDGTAVFITHCEGSKIVLDYHELWRAGVDWRETNPHLGNNYSCEYAKQISMVERLDFDEISQWIIGLSKRFFIADAIFDRWNGIPLEQAFVKAGLRQFKSEFFTRDVASKIYQNAKLMIYDEKLSLYDLPKGEKGKHSPFIQEILTLQATQASKNVVVVEAPDHVGYHDDMADAFVRAVWLSSQKLASHHIAAGHSRSGTGGSQAQVTVTRYQMQRAKYHGGFNERVTPRGLGLKMRGR